MDQEAARPEQQRTARPRATLGIYTHRFSNYLEKLLFSIGKRTTESVDIRLQIQPGNVHENMARVAENVETEFFVWLDEDIQFLTDNWLEMLLEHFKDHSVGMVTCMQVKDKHMVDPTIAHAKKVKGGYVSMAWAPGHVFAIRADLLQSRAVFPDCDIPGVKGMSDLDLCLQVRKNGLKVVNDERVVVWHPHKPDNDYLRKADGQPTLTEERAVFDKQRDYMLSKWGDFYIESVSNQVLDDERIL